MDKKRKMRSFAKRLTAWIMVMMLITMGLTSYLIYSLGSSFALEEEYYLHKAYVDLLASDIRRVLSDVYVGTVNHVPYIEQSLDRPDHLKSIVEQVVKQNPRIHSCGISFVADYYPQKGRWFCPYATRLDSTHIETTSYTDSTHDYLSAEWFNEALQADSGYWSKPFFEQRDTSVTLVAYLHPIRDKQGRTVAILGADLSLDWLQEKMEKADYEIVGKEWTLNNNKKKKELGNVSRNKWMTYSFIIDGDGTYLVHPERERIMRKNIFDYTKADPDSLSTCVAREMTAGHKGYYGENSDNEDLVIYESGWDPYDGMVFDGRLSYVFYTPIEHTSWSLGLSTPKLSISIVGYIVGFMLLLLIAIGMLVVYLVCRVTIRRVTSPLKQLAASAGEVAQGHFNTPLPVIKHNDEIGLLRNSFEDMQRSLVDYIDELKTTTASKASIESELMVAHNIQMGMLPKTFPPYPDRSDIDIYGLLTPAKEVGGDLFDFYIHDELLFFCIGDVSGKGVPASLLMAVTRSLFRNITLHTSEPRHIVEALNNALFDGNESCMFVTLFLGVLDLGSGRLRYCNAGHDSPLLTGHGVRMLPCDPNMPLGVMPGWSYTQQETIVPPSATIFLYTDGLTEAEDKDHAQFGIERVEAVTKGLQEADGDVSPRNIVEGMASAVHTFVGDAAPSDDLTMLAVKYLKQQ